MSKKRTRTRTSSKAQQQQSGVSTPMIIGVAVAAVLIVVGLVLLGNWSQGKAEPVDVSSLATIGDADAPVTIIEYSDFG